MPPPRILLADDDPEVLSLFADALAQAGYAVDAVHNGWELCERLGLLDEASPRAVPYALVISDVRMPAVTGLEALEGLFALPTAERPLPVVLVSSYWEPKQRAEAMRFGAIVLDKPVAIPALLDVVRDALAVPAPLDALAPSSAPAPRAPRGHPAPRAPRGHPAPRAPRGHPAPRGGR